MPLETEIGIALVFDEAVASAFVKLQESSFSVVKLEPNLSLNGNIPHVSIIQGALKHENCAGAVWENLRKTLTLSARDLQLRFDQITYKETGWYFLTILRSNALEQLQMYTLASMEPHLLTSVAGTNKSITHYTDDEVHSFKKYGYRYIGKAFFPHVTLGWSPDGYSEATLNTLAECYAHSAIPQIVAPSAITMYRLGKQGAHAEMLFALRL